MRQACFTTPQECLPRRLDLHITLSCYLLNKTLASLMALVSFVCFSFPLWPDLHHRSSCNYIIDTGCTYLSFLSLKMQPEPSLSFLPSFLPFWPFFLPPRSPKSHDLLFRSYPGAGLNVNAVCNFSHIYKWLFFSFLRSVLYFIFSSKEDIWDIFFLNIGVSLCLIVSD